jgi:hypothetical protein
MRATGLVFLVAIAMVIVSGCDKKTNPVDAGSVGTYVGYFISIDTTAGLIVINVQESGSVSGNAYVWEDTLVAVPITGSISNNTFTGTAAATGQDGPVSLTATLSGTTITGTANNGEAAYTLTLASGTVTVRKYYGSYSGSSTEGPESGNLFICTAATTMWGVVFESGGSGQVDYLVGVVTGNSVSIRGGDDPATQVASGTLSGNTWSGTYTGDQSSGTWSVTLVP